MGYDTTYHPEVDELIDALRPIACQARVEDAYWITTPDGEYLSNNGNEWCRDCGSAKVKHLRRHDRRHADAYILDGGWVSEHESPPMCAGCGVKLRATLLIYGGISELDHFRGHPPELSPSQAYEISEMLSAFQYTKPEHDDLAREAIAIGRALVSLLHQGAA